MNATPLFPKKIGIFLTVFPLIFTLSYGQVSPGDEVLNKNIAAAGSADRLAGVDNLSFKTDQRTYYMSKEGNMKITVGTPPIITQSILAIESGVQRNCYNDITDVIPLMASTYRVQALLRSGFFTLRNFRDNLSYDGLKKYGIKSLHKFSTTIDKLDVEFYIDDGSFTLQRMVLKGVHPVTGTYEVNNDFGPYKDYEGIRMPSSWFASQVGTR